MNKCGRLHRRGGEHFSLGTGLQRVAIRIISRCITVVGVSWKLGLGCNGRGVFGSIVLGRRTFLRTFRAREGVVIVGVVQKIKS